MALFHYYLGVTLGGSGDLDAAATSLELAMHAAAVEPMPPSLYSGFSGIAWTLAHLQRKGFDAARHVDLVEIDEVLSRFVRRRADELPYDLISGLVGIGVYCVERLPEPSAASCLDAVVEQLEARSRLSEQGRSWFTDPRYLPPSTREVEPDGLYDLGVAHGAAGALGFLAAVYGSGGSDHVRTLLAGGFDWLRRHRLPQGGPSCYAYSLDSRLEPRSAARAAWCYGDPGIGAVLSNAARVLGDAEAGEDARGVVARSGARSKEDSGVLDACLCHGAAGAAHIMNRQHQATGDLRLKAAARDWFDQTLSMRTTTADSDGFIFRSFLGEVEDWGPRPGFLEGAAGVGLALLAAITDEDPGWDRLLLLSLPREAAGAGAR